MSILDVALAQAKEENSVESILELYAHLLNVSMFIDQFIDKASSVQDEVLANLKDEG